MYEEGEVGSKNLKGKVMVLPLDLTLLRGEEGVGVLLCLVFAL